MDNRTIFDEHNDLLLVLYKILSPICICLNILSIYLIIFKSTREMDRYRWHLLNYQVWTTSIDLSINCLFEPIVFFPIIAASGHGIIITKLGISTFTCFRLFIFFMGASLTSVLQLFFYRHQCIAHGRYKLNNCQFYFCILLCFSALSITENIFFERVYIDQSLWSEMLMRLNPNAIDLLEIPNLFYIPYSHDIKIFFSALILVLIFTTVAIVALIVHIQSILQTHSNRLSLKTRRLQRTFLMALILQVGGPIIFFFIPFIYACIRIADGRLGLQILNNLHNLMYSSHGTIATLFLIYSNTPYREFVLGKWKKKYVLNSITINPRGNSHMASKFQL